MKYKLGVALIDTEQIIRECALRTLQNIYNGHPKEFKASGLKYKLGAALDRTQPDIIRQKALKTLGGIYNNQPQEFNKQTYLKDKLVAALDCDDLTGDETQHKNVRIEALKTLGDIYNNQPQEFQTSGLSDKLGDALFSDNPDICKNALNVLYVIYGSQADEARIHLYNDTFQRKY